MTRPLRASSSPISGSHAEVHNAQRGTLGCLRGWLSWCGTSGTLGSDCQNSCASTPCSCLRTREHMHRGYATAAYAYLHGHRYMYVRDVRSCNNTLWQPGKHRWFASLLSVVSERDHKHSIPSKTYCAGRSAYLSGSYTTAVLTFLTLRKYIGSGISNHLQQRGHWVSGTKRIPGTRPPQPSAPTSANHLVCISQPVLSGYLA